MGYQSIVYGLFRALAQHANIPVDFIDEDQLTDSALKPYSALIITEPDVPVEGQQAVLRWVKAGGGLLTASGAMANDRYNTPAALLSKATGVVEEPRKRLMTHAASAVKAVATGSGTLGNLTAYGVAGRFTQTGPTTETLAHFSSGRDQTHPSGPPMIVRSKVGAGAVTQFAFLPQAHYRFMDPYHPSPNFNSPTNFTDGSAPFLLQFARDHVQPRVTVSAPLVEAPLLLSAGGAVLTLLNWHSQPITSLVVSVRLDFAVRSVESTTAVPATAGSGTRPIPFHCAKVPGTQQFLVTFSLRLDHGDFVLLTALQA